MGLRIFAFAGVWAALGFYLMGSRAGAPPPNPPPDDPDSLPVVYMDVSVNNAPPKRMTFRLRSDVAPKTADNFRRLCTGDNDRKLSYNNSVFHRIIPGFIAQAGDVIDGSGMNSESTYGGFFKDEPFVLRHTSRGLLSMANRGPNTNGSQFFITFGPAAHLNGRHVVFGELIGGEDVIRELEQIGSRGGKPIARAVIRSTGDVPKINDGYCLTTSETFCCLDTSLPEFDNRPKKPNTTYPDLFVSPINNATYIELVSTAPRANTMFGYIPDELVALGDTTYIYTRFRKIRLDPDTMLVNTRDFTYAEKLGSTVLYGSFAGRIGYGSAVPYGTAMDCNGAGSKKGEAIIDLRGTPYAVDDEWDHTGVDSAGTWEFSEGNQVVKITGGGNCGMAAPKRAIEQGTCGPAGGWHLKLKRIVDEVPACSKPCQGFTASCQQPAADQCTCPAGKEGVDCAEDLTRKPDTIFFDADTLMETRKIYQQYRTADYLTYPDNYFQYGSLINDTVNATLPGLPATIVIPSQVNASNETVPWVYNRTETVLKAVENIVMMAEALYNLTGYVRMTVTNKTYVPPSGDKHDYVSNGPYWYPREKAPCLNDPEGQASREEYVARLRNMTFNTTEYQSVRLANQIEDAVDIGGDSAWIRCDGVVNPDFLAGGEYYVRDKDMRNNTQYGVFSMALAHWYTGAEKYAERASEMLYSMFLNPVTRMNPNLEFSQGIPTVIDGRPTGIIEFIDFPCFVLEPSRVLVAANTRYWRKQDHERLMDWAREFLDWLVTSNIGTLDRYGINNHASFYHQLTIGLAAELGNQTVLKEMSDMMAKRDIQNQMGPDGSLPFEVIRTRSRHYTTYSLLAFARAAVFAKSAGEEVMITYEGPEKQSLKHGMEWTMPKAIKEEEWPYYDQKGWSWMVSMFPEAAWLAANAYDRAEWFNNIPLIDGFNAEFFKRDSLHLYMKRPDGVKGVDEA